MSSGRNAGISIIAGVKITRAVIRSVGTSIAIAGFSTSNGYNIGSSFFFSAPTT